MKSLTAPVSLFISLISLTSCLGAGPPSRVAIDEIPAGSPALEAGLQRGDEILEMNRQRIHRLKDYERVLSALKPGERVLLLIRRGGSMLFVPVQGFHPGSLVVRDRFSGQTGPQIAGMPPPAPQPSPPPVAPAPGNPAPALGRLPSVDFGRYHALVIGNNRYRHVRPLETAVADATAVAHVLREAYGFTVTLLTDATREQILDAFYQLRATLTEQDNALLYYAGHGVLDEAAERGYWLPVDAERDKATHWIATTDITDTLKAMTAKHVLVVADSCYAGTLARGVGVSAPKTGEDPAAYVTRLAAKRSRTALLAGGLEPVLDRSGRTGHSVFAQAFLTALQENAGVLEGEGLFLALRRAVVVNAPQTPEYVDIRFAGHEGGDFLFVRR